VVRRVVRISSKDDDNDMDMTFNVGRTEGCGIWWKNIGVRLGLYVLQRRSIEMVATVFERTCASSQKYVKSHVFWIFKNVKSVTT